MVFITTITEKDVHSIGNGKSLMYFRGSDVINAYGAPYSSTDFFSLETLNAETLSKRTSGTAIWTHTILTEQGQAAIFTDYMAVDRAVFIRDIKADATIILKLCFKKNVEGHFMGEYVRPNSLSYLMCAGKATTFFQDMPIPWECDMLLTVTGNTVIKECEGGAEIVISKGTSRLIFSSANHFPDALDNTLFVLNSTDNAILCETQKYWQAFTKRRTDFTNKISAKNPLKTQMLDCIDSVAVMIKCQQSMDGGVSAGHYYNMAYVRDMAGVLRGLLALGLYDEAKGILNFWLRKFQIFGNVLNAEGMCNDSARLIYENDEVEIPAYLILCAFTYAEKIGDKLYLFEYFKLMKWAFSVQLSHLVNGMTEFSCDETYIAGGTFPRYLAYHGSAESTMLFILSGEKFLNFAEEHNLLTKETLEQYKSIVADAKGKYKANFVENGVLYANQPSREKLSPKPRFRFGYCDAHDSLHLQWTENFGDGYYKCPNCKNVSLPIFEDPEKRHVMNSVNLMLLYMGSDIFSNDEMKQLLNDATQTFVKTDKIPSNADGNKALGYDSGLFLYNLLVLESDREIINKAAKKLLKLSDNTGVWSEYYIDDMACHCRARPWESGINIEALIKHIGGIDENN